LYSERDKDRARPPDGDPLAGATLAHTSGHPRVRPGVRLRSGPASGSTVMVPVMRTGPRLVRAILAAAVLVAFVPPDTAAAVRSKIWPKHKTVNGFARAAPWNTKLPRHIPLDPRSAEIVANLKADKDNSFGVWPVTTDTFSSPIYTVGPDAPRQRWHDRWSFEECFNTGEGPPPEFLDALASVPTLPDMITSLGTDNHITIYQPSTDTYWDFWRARRDESGQWSACWGGKIERYSRNLGIHAFPQGATASGLPVGAFTIRIAELRRGRIDHAINMATVRTRANCASWPANRTDGVFAGDDIACQGQRFRLDPAFDVTTLGNPAARTIARAMQEYGLILTDKSDALITWAEDPRPYMLHNGGSNPYDELFGGVEWHSVLNEIPVDRLQALPLHYGRPS
jgi:hypothetical protein